MNMVKKIGIVGVGNRLRSLIEIIEKNNMSDFIYYIYDPEMNAINNFREKMSEEKVVICESYEEILENVDIEWVMVGSLNSLHREQIIKAFKAGKNVFAEKPLAISLEELMKIKKVFLENEGLKFLISYPLRHSMFYNKIKDIVDSGKIGKVVSMEFNEVLKFTHGAFIMSDWRRYENLSGGHLLEKCCHDIDLVNWILKSLPKRVSSFGGKNIFTEKNSSIFEDVKNREEYLEKLKKVKMNPYVSEKDIVDNQVSIVEYENGARSMFHTNCCSGIPERRMYICGTKGTIRADVLLGKMEIKALVDDEIEVIIDEQSKGGHGGGDLFLMKEFVSVVMGEKSSDVYLDDAIKSAVSAIMIDEARKENKVIDLTEIWKSFNY
jgi:predicted dehydrogenase